LAAFHQQSTITVQPAEEMSVFLTASLSILLKINGTGHSACQFLWMLCVQLGGKVKEECKQRNTICRICPTWKM